MMSEPPGRILSFDDFPEGHPVQMMQDRERMLRQALEATAPTPPAAAAPAEIQATAADLPSLPVMVGNLARDGAATLSRAARGHRIRRTPEEHAACLAVCQGDGTPDRPACPKWIEGRDRCTLCGCWVSQKAWWLASKCPLDKWPS